MKVAAVLAVVAVGAALAGVALWQSRSGEAAVITRFEHLLPQSHALPLLFRRVVTISADGDTFLYNTRAGFYVRSMDELEARLLPGTEGAVDPVLAPDGQWVAFVAGGELRKVPIADGPAVTLCRVGSTASGISWGADQTIVFAQADGIARVSANGGEPQLIVRAETGEALHKPQLLPGGDAVLFSVTMTQGNTRWDSAKIAVFSLSQTRRTVIVEEATDGVYLPSGHLVYAKRDGLFGVSFDARTLTTSGGTVALVQGIQPPAGITGAGVNFDVSDSGTLIYLARRIEQRSLVWLSVNGDAVTPVTTIPPGDYEDPRLSPDGSRLVVTRDHDIWVFDLASGRTTRITRDGGSQMGVWDPSGTRIAFSSGRTGGAVEAWVAPADGSGAPRQLTQLGGAVHVDSWSPDGRLLTMHHHPVIGGGHSIMYMLAMDQANARPMPFPVGDFPAEGADFSASGRHVVFLSTATGRREIYIRPYPDPGEQVIVSVDGGMEPVWAANGDIFYRGLNGDRLYKVPVSAGASPKAGAPRLLSSRAFYRAPTGSPRPQFDVTADGQQVLILTSTTLSGDRDRIVVVQNWIEELKQRIPGQ
jgi:serine/threonine-protein kinase